MVNRPRRLRRNAQIRDMVRETRLCITDLICPIFVVEGSGIKSEIPSLKGIYHFSIDKLEEEVKEIIALGLTSVILFGVPNRKDDFGKEASSKMGIIQKAIKEIKRVAPELYVITDVCLCQYTSHGHCGILDNSGIVDNDKTLVSLGEVALSHAISGADMVAPSDMMDGRVDYIRKVLDNNNFMDIPIMPYSAKYSSNYYGPFREAVSSSPAFGDRKTYQMDSANSDEAIREIKLDIEEGADLIIIKPALSYLDIIQRAKDNFNIPIVAYNVSGEYAMLKMAVDNGVVSEQIIYETILSIKRAGATMIITYFAKYLATKM
ncbi:MAG: delta-aminolevulinic acid dehydratase [Epulopiscium sp. Nele67-Bin005]|nr:MAG: delta-aminolevulinic acid dehydratase [Epulopiscium sp. Nele67-Bin005]